MSQDINLNAAHCIQSATSFGHTTYTNICNGTTTVIEWGGVDWALCGIVMAIAALCVILCFGLVSILMDSP